MTTHKIISHLLGHLLGWKCLLEAKALRLLGYILGLYAAVDLSSAYAMTGARDPQAETTMVETEVSLDELPATSSSDNTATSLRVVDIEIQGTVRVEDSAVISQLTTEIGSTITETDLAENIRSLFALGYFSHIEAYTELFDAPGSAHNDVTLVIKVIEKPAIISISYKGFDEIPTDDIEKKLNTKVFTIVSQSDLNEDLKTIENMHKEKGFFLAEASYNLISQSDNEVHLEFRLVLGSRLYISSVNFVGNTHFNDFHLLDLIISQPYDRTQQITGSPYFLEAGLERDEQLLSYTYQDHGYAEAQVGTTLRELSADQKFIDLTFYIEEGIRYNFGDISFSGDLLFSQEELHEQIQVESGTLFRISQLRSSLESLSRSYGDLGYAFVDIYPKTTFNREEKTVDLQWQIRSGEKAYIGRIDIVGNTKTRDHVIRRELSLSEGQLFSSTGLDESRADIERLGFFESVNMVRQRDETNPRVLHYTVKIEEKSTGQIQASIGYTPGGYAEANWFGQGQYDEKNQSGKGWNLGLSLTYSNSESYGTRLHFGNPRIYDSLWSGGFSVEHKKQRVVALGFSLLETKNALNVYTGRTLFEKVRGTVGWEASRTEQDSDLYLSRSLRISGDTFGVVLSVSRKDLDNYLDPTDGNELRLSQRFVGGPLGGDYSYRESELEALYYYPITLGESYRTHIKLRGEYGQLNSYYGSAPPFFQRYRLGGPFNLRGFAANSITPRFVYWKSPFDYDEAAFYPKGGDRKIVAQAEYYMPLISKARIKALVFADAGRVFDNDESFTIFEGIHSNVGFGLRMITPLGPFRFEWAFPTQDDGTLGPYRFIFNIGY